MRNTIAKSMGAVKRSLHNSRRLDRALTTRLRMQLQRTIAVAACATVLLPSAAQGQGTQPADAQATASAENLKQLSLEQLGNIEVTTVTKEPEDVWNTAAAIYVLTQEDIRRSGFTTIPDVLRLVPGVEVARIDSDHWAVGIRGFGSEFSKSVLVLKLVQITDSICEIKKEAEHLLA